MYVYETIRQLKWYGDDLSLEICIIKNKIYDVYIVFFFLKSQLKFITI